MKHLKTILTALVIFGCSLTVHAQYTQVVPSPNGGAVIYGSDGSISQVVPNGNGGAVIYTAPAN